MKKLQWKSVSCIILIVVIVLILVWYNKNGEPEKKESYDDGIVQLELDSIYLKAGDVQVDFSEVIVGKEKESRKLIVYEQEATASNGQKADDIALEMVKKVYEPVIKAIDSGYSVNIEFK